jgi:type II secretory ATPase GspE/PulE/Tfp pilus assembly ATPase PilB-like protein
MLQEMMNIPRDRVPEVISRIKVMSRMDIAEKRRSQDGRIRIAEKGRDIDIRVSTLPTDFGEKTGIFEVLPITEKLRTLTNAKAYAEETRKQAVAEGMVLLRENALARLTDGVTSLEEVLREISVVV